MKIAFATMAALIFTASLALAQSKDRDTPPLKGANSFTEGEAKSRAESHGFSEIKDLKKDDDGIWRGHATQQGKSVEIAIDYKGNVVPTTQQ
jgi:hypothetical protein